MSVGRRRRERPSVWGYVVGVGLSAFAVAATWALADMTGPTFFGLALLGVATTVWIAGGGPALLATAITAAGIAFVAIEPTGSFAIRSRDDALRWVLFVLAALVIAGAGHVMRSARRRAESSEQRLLILSRVNEALGSPASFEDRLRSLAAVLVPALADTARLSVELADGSATVAEARAFGAAADVTLTTAPAGEGSDPSPGHGAGAWHDAARTSAGVLLVASSSRVGAIVLTRTRRRGPFRDEDLTLLEQIGRRAALQLENARLHEAERAAAEALARSDALKTTMLRGVSHELRTPLTAMMAAAEAIEQVADGAERDELARLVVDEARRLETVVANLLDLSRLDGGILHPRLDDCSVAELVAGSRAATAGLFEEGDVVAAVASDCPLVRADPVLTERILVNLLQNAAAHGRAPVRVEAAPRNGSVELTVRDHGAGVPPAIRESVFEAYTHDGAGGLGIGLNLSRRLAQAQGARLELVEDGDAGACFLLAIPRADLRSVDP